MWCCYRTNISHAAITNLNSVLAKWLSVRLQTKWLWVRFQLQSWKVLLCGKCSFTNFKNVWRGCSTVTDTIMQQLLARSFNSHWHDSSAVAGMILQQSRARFFIFSTLAEFFNSDVHCWRIVPCTRYTTHDPLFNNNNSLSIYWLNLRKYCEKWCIEAWIVQLVK